MDDEWRWKPVGEETEKLLRTVRAKKRRNEFQVVDGGKRTSGEDRRSANPPPQADALGGNSARDIGCGERDTAKEN